MRVICSQCNASYTLPPHKIPKNRAVATCKRCGWRIVIDAPSTPEVEHRTTFPAGASHYPPPSGAVEGQHVQREAILAVYPELRNLPSEKYALGEILAPNRKGNYKSRKNKFKIKVLRSVDYLLGRMLKDGERVVRVGKGTAYYGAEIFLGNGFLTMLYNTYAIVCTNQRVLLININYRMRRPTHYLFQIGYETVKKVKRGFLSSSLIIYPMKGRRRVFTYVKRYLAKELQQAIIERKDSVAAGDHGTTYIENLCPSCFGPVEKGFITCPHCCAHFKEPKKAFLRSLLLPGWGDMYLGHRALGFLELMGSALVWTVVVSSVLAGPAESLVGAFVILMFYNGTDSLLTRHMANKGYMLAKK